MEKRKTAWVDISSIVREYLPVSKRKARRFVDLYLTKKRVGNRIYVEREQLEQLLSDPMVVLRFLICLVPSMTLLYRRPRKKILRI